MSISSNQYLQFHDYLTQVMNVSGKNGVPKITQGVIGEKLSVDSSGVSRFLTGKTVKPAKMMNNFVLTYPLEFNQWPKSADKVCRVITSTDALYFLNPKKSAASERVSRSMPVPEVSIAAQLSPVASCRARPSIQTPVVASYQAGGVESYFGRIRDGDTTVPGEAVQKSIANLLDRTEAAVVNDFLNKLRMSKEHQARIQKLKAQPRLAGSFHSKKIILDYESSSSFEQMAALSDWLAQKKIQKDHTFFFSTSDGDYIPVYVKKYDNIDATSMHVMLGSKTGSHKAPKYDDWAVTDPWFEDSQKRFISPLESLEIVRQPAFSAATVLKGNAYETNLVDTTHRYGSEYACVEEKGQSKNSSKKMKSAGFNACAFVNDFSDVVDPTADEVDFTLPVNYEDYTEDGYLDDLDVSVTPGKLMKAAKDVLVNNNEDTELRQLMENLTIAKLGVQRTPLLSQYIAEKLAANNTADR